MAPGRTNSTPSAESKTGVARRLAAFVVVALGILITLPPECFPALQRIDRSYNPLGSYFIDIPMRLHRAEWSGRDFIYTSGPVYQVMRDLGRIVPRGDVASVIRFNQVLEVVFSMLCVWGLLSATRGPLAWRSVCYFVWAVYWDPLKTVGISPLGGLMLIVASVQALEASRRFGGPRRRIWAAGLWALSAPILLFYKFDLGVMTLLALLFIACVIAICSIRIPSPGGRAMGKHALESASASIFGAGAFILGFAALPGWRRYLTDSWDLAMGYTVKMSLPIANQDLALIAAGILISGGIAIFAAGRLRRAWHTDDAGATRAIGLLAAAIFAAVFTRYGLSRSYWTSVRLALSGAMFVSGLMLPCYLRAERNRGAWLALMFWVPIVFFSTHGTPLTILGELPERCLRINSLEWVPAKLEVTHDAIREATRVASRWRSDSVYVWPFESIVNPLANKRSPAYTVQNYAALTDALERATNARLAAEPDPLVILFRNSWDLDSVENITRTPLIFRHLVENYELAASPTHSAFLALRRRSPGSVTWRVDVLANVEGRFDPGDRPSIAWDLSTNAEQDCRISDLIVLELRASRTPFYGIGKPGILTVTMQLSTGESRTRKILLPPDGQSHEVLVCASSLQHESLPRLFLATPSWRDAERVTALKLEWAPMDLLSRRPESVTLERASVLRPASVSRQENIDTEPNASK
jgi:hypothetical protein